MINDIRKQWAVFDGHVVWRVCPLDIEVKNQSFVSRRMVSIKICWIVYSHAGTWSEWKISASKEFAQLYQRYSLKPLIFRPFLTVHTCISIIKTFMLHLWANVNYSYEFNLCLDVINVDNIYHLQLRCIVRKLAFVSSLYWAIILFHMNWK